MKSTPVVVVIPRFMRAQDAAKFMGGERLIRDMETAKWIKPVHRHKRVTLFRVTDLQACADRIEAGEYPGRTSEQ